MRALIVAVGLLAVSVGSAFGQASQRMAIQVQGIDIRTTGVFVLWRACAVPITECIDGETLEPILAELPGTTNNRIEQDAKTKIQDANPGLTINGVIHIIGGRTS